MLREVATDPPFSSPHGKLEEAWAKIAKALQELGVPVTARGARDRYNYLVKLFHSEDLKNLRKSGTEEEFTEREALLTELIELQESSVEKKESERKRDARDQELGKQIQSDALKSLKEKRLRQQAQSDSDRNGEASDTKKAKSSCANQINQALMDFLTSKAQRRTEEVANERLRLQLEDKKADIERDRLRVDEEKIKLERMRLEAEMRDRESQRELTKAQLLYFTERSKK